MSAISNKMKWIGLIALKTGVFGFGLTIGVQHAPDIKAAWYGVTHGFQPAAQYFHEDGYHVKVENPTNDKGELQTYITYNGKQIEVYEDLMPSNLTIYETLNDRVNSSTEQQLDSLNRKTEHLQLLIDRMRGVDLSDERAAMRELRILGEKNPELFDQMGGEFQAYALDKLYTRLMDEVYGGAIDGK